MKIYFPSSGCIIREAMLFGIHICGVLLVWSQFNLILFFPKEEKKTDKGKKNSKTPKQTPQKTQNTKAHKISEYNV